MNADSSEVRLSKDTLVPASVIIGALIFAWQFSSSYTRLSQKVDSVGDGVEMLNLKVEDMRAESFERARREVALELRIDILEDDVQGLKSVD